MKKKSFLLFLLFVSALWLTACKTDVTRNGDGTLTLESSMTQSELQEAITAALADPLIQDLQVTLQNGYVDVNGTRQRLNDVSQTDTLYFRLDLSAMQGDLTAVISNAQLAGKPVEQNRVAHWNETLENRLGKNNGAENAVLQSVLISPAQVTMTWLITRQ